MGTAQVKPKSKSNTKHAIEPPKQSIKVNIDPSRPVPLELLLLTNWSLQEIKTMYQTFQRMAQSPMIDYFIFRKIMPLSKKNSQIVYQVLTQGQKFMSIFELIGILVITSYHTYRKKFQFLCLLFDFEHKFYVNGRQFLLIFFSLLYGYCRLTQQKHPPFQTVQRYSHASFFPGEDDFEDKQVSLRKFIEEYDGNSNISDIFNRFQRVQFKEIKEDPLIFALSQFKKYDQDDVLRFYRILYKIYSKADYEEVFLIQQNKQLRRQNRRDSCYKQLIQQKNSIFEHVPPLQTKRSQSLAKIHSLASVQYKVQISPTKGHALQQSPTKLSDRDSFRVKKLASLSGTPHHLQKSNQFSHPRKLIFLNGHTHSKNEIFETINYFKTFSGVDDKISIKEFFKKFENKVYLKKQLSSIFKYLDYEKKGEISLQNFFKSFYPGINDEDLRLLSKWYTEYQEIYEADSLARNQAKVTVMSDARLLSPETLERMREIFRAIDIGHKGYINFQDIRKAFKQGYTADELENLLKVYGDGKNIKLGGLCKMLLPEGWTIEGIDLNNLEQQELTS